MANSELKGRLSCKDKELVLQFRADHPETIGETDTTFDYGNYIEWLEKKIKTNQQQPDNSEALREIDDKITAYSLTEKRYSVAYIKEVLIDLKKIRALIGGVG